MVVKNEMKDLVAKKEKQQEANECSKSVASLYNGKPCMGTNIHARDRVPNSTPWDGFLFDHEYTFKCHAAADFIKQSPLKCFSC